MRLPRLVLLAAREEGYRNLMRLTSRAFLDTPSGERPHVKLAALEQAAGLVALTGGAGGPLDLAFAAGQAELAAARCERLTRLFGDRLYVELQRHALPEEKQLEPALLDLAYAKGLPLVAANEPYFAAPRGLRGARRADLHRRGPAVAESERRQLTPEHYFKIARRDGGAVRRPARGARLDGRDRASAAPTGRRSASRSCRASRATDGAAVDEAAELRREAEEGLDAAHRTLGLASGPHRSRTIASGSTSSSASSRAWGIPATS